VQSQARELSQLRQQIKESRRLGALQRRQLDELSKAFKELLQAGEVDYYMGEAVKEQLDKSLGILDRLEGRLDKGSGCSDLKMNLSLYTNPNKQCSPIVQKCLCALTKRRRERDEKSGHS